MLFRLIHNTLFKTKLVVSLGYCAKRRLAVRMRLQKITNTTRTRTVGRVELPSVRGLFGWFLNDSVIVMG